MSTHIQERADGRATRNSFTQVVVHRAAWAFVLLLLAPAPLTAAAPPSAWPQAYTVQRDDAAGWLTLSTPFYTVRHDLKQGGTIAAIRLTHGRASNLLVRPVQTWVRDDNGARFADVNDRAARVSQRKENLTEIVTVESELADEQGRASGIRTRTVFEYHWGYIKIHKEFSAPSGSARLRELCACATVLAPSLADYGYREGLTEREGAPAFAFGSCKWGKLRQPSDPSVKTLFVPRYMMFADAGVEGLEWFVGSDLAQWDLQLAGRRGQGQCLFELSRVPAGLAFSVSPFRGEAPIALPKTCAFDFYLGLPLLEGHARKPWLHTSFNRNQGKWVSPEQIRRWAESGLQTVHCHNDGDYYEDGLFWRDGSYPPYPDMENYDKVLKECRQAGIRTATYFSNKELHPSTAAFQQHGVEWGREDSKGKLQHNFFKGTNEFGVQMCLRSGWLQFLKNSIDRVLTNSPLDGVYYDWNVALLCYNGRHEGKPAGEIGAGHWDIDELLDLMEWTRRRVGPDGLVIVHNTTTPMFCTENFADDVVANEWGYGKWTGDGPELAALPLEWSLVGARARGVISYGQLDSQSPKGLHRLFALEALVSGVTPWPASPETFELAPMLKPLGDLERYRFLDWRNPAVKLEGKRCASAIYSRPGECYVLLANLDKEPQTVRCRVDPSQLPYPLAQIRSATVLGGGAGGGQEIQGLTGEGVPISVPATSMVVLQVR